MQRIALFVGHGNVNEPVTGIHKHCTGEIFISLCNVIHGLGIKTAELDDERQAEYAARSNKGKECLGFVGGDEHPGGAALIFCRGDAGYSTVEEKATIEAVRTKETFDCYKRLGIPHDHIIRLGFKDFSAFGNIGWEKADGKPGDMPVILRFA